MVAQMSTLRPFSLQIAPQTIMYDPNKALLQFVAWSGTVTKIVLSSPYFWFLMILNVVLSLVYYQALGDHENLDFQLETYRWPFMSSFIYTFFGGLVTFMVVVHAGDCYTRSVRPCNQLPDNHR